MPTQIVGKTVTVKSVGRESGSFNDFVVDLTDSNVDDTNADVLVRSTSIPNTIYNVNEYTNIFTWDENSLTGGTGDTTPQKVTIDKKDYTGSNLASAIEGEMNAVSGGLQNFTVSYDSSSAKFSFSTTTSSKSFRLDFSASSAPMSRLLGFANGSTTDWTDTGSTLQSTYLAQLFPALSYQAHVEGFFEGAVTGSSKKSNLISIQARVPFGHVLFYEPTDSNEAYHIRDFFGKKRFFLMVDFGNGLGPKPAPIQGDWEMFLAVRKFRSEKPHQPTPLIDQLETKAVNR